MINNIIEDNDNNTSVTYAKIGMALSEAEMQGHEIKLVSFSAEPNLLCEALCSWMNQDQREVKAKLIMKDVETFESLCMLSNVSQSLIDSSIKVKDLNAMLIIGKNIALFDVKGSIHIQRKELFVKEALRILRSVKKINDLIDIKNAQNSNKKSPSQ